MYSESPPKDKGPVVPFSRHMHFVCVCVCVFGQLKSTQISTDTTHNNILLAFV